MYKNILRNLFLGIVLSATLLFVFSNKVQAAPDTIDQLSGSPSIFRTLCDAGTPVDFAVSATNVRFDLTSGTLSYNINLQWKRCSNSETRAYAIYSDLPDVCPYSGWYGTGGTQVTDCVKYIGSPAYSGAGNGLKCGALTDADCVTGSFTGARREENQPSYSLNSITIPMSKHNALWYVANDNGSWTITNKMCQFYKTGYPNFNVTNNNRCVDVSVSVKWSGSTPFNLSLKGEVKLKEGISDENESPTSATFQNIGAITSRSVNGIVLSRSYIIRRIGFPDQIINPVPPDTTVNIPAGAFGVTLPSDSRPLPVLTAGDQVCVIVTAKPGSGTANSFNTIISRGPDKSATYCDKVVNKPFVSFYGADVNAGSSFTSCPVTSKKILTFIKPSTNLGSGVQFGVRSFGSIEGFASARGTSYVPNGLSFANTSGTYGGNFGPSICNPDYFASAPKAPTPGPITISNGSKKFTGNFTLNSQAIPNNTRSAVYIEGNLHIAGNINYASTPWNSIDEIPSLHVYVKGNITIAPTVTKLTGFYVAQPNPSVPNSGTISTCANSINTPLSLTDPSYFTVCNKRLTIRGALVSRKTNFMRVAGSLRDAKSFLESKSTSSMAAEIIHLGPEMFMVGPKEEIGPNAQVNNKYDSVTELPSLL